MEQLYQKTIWYYSVPLNTHVFYDPVIPPQEYTQKKKKQFVINYNSQYKIQDSNQPLETEKEMRLGRDYIEFSNVLKMFLYLRSINIQVSFCICVYIYKKYFLICVIFLYHYIKYQYIKIS